MTDAPKRIIARIDYDGEIDGQWIDADAPRPHSFGHYFTEYTRADLIDMDVLQRVEAAGQNLRAFARLFSDDPATVAINEWDAALTAFQAMMEKLK